MVILSKKTCTEDHTSITLIVTFRFKLVFPPHILGDLKSISLLQPRAKLDYIFDYYINGVFLEDIRFYQKILLEYPEGSLREIHSSLLDDESKEEEAMHTEEKNRKDRIAKMQKQNKE